ncbi:hypothetical protein AAV94_02265 [Lampropedia cohaerens]|uniref:HTH gntR-type domain-containing protein n=2 Tax=Lampropedia cohaerens TaxID=1610491 RepID=A0A0U1Q2V2_9BURK|nr:hypothetical protein AAV94_02265 [Lampropedia cohaerens]
MYARLLTAILEHRLQPGTKLAEENLAKVFGVSRTRVRPVLVRLAQERLVELRPRRSPTVARPTQAEAHEVFEARSLIEPRLVQACTTRASDVEIAQLRQCIHDEHAALARGDHATAVRLSGQFHMHIADCARQQTLRDILADLVSRTSLILMLYGSARSRAKPGERSPHSCGTACQCHDRLVDAIALRDAATAQLLMQEHLLDLQSSLVFPVAVAHTDLETVLAGAQ